MFRDKNLQKLKNDLNFLHSAFVFATQTKTTFFTFSSPNPCANQRSHCCFAGLEILTDEPTDGRTEDRPSQAGPRSRGKNLSP